MDFLSLAAHKHVATGQTELETIDFLPTRSFSFCRSRLLNPLVTPPVLAYRVREYVSSFFMTTLMVVFPGYDSPWQALEV